MFIRLTLTCCFLGLAVGSGRAQPAPPPKAAVTAPANSREKVMARYKLARNLAQAGKYPEALTEFVWCLDVGMRQDPVFQEIRGDRLLADIRVLAEAYPPALAALMERRDQARASLVSGRGQPADAADFVSLNQVLDRQKFTLATYDQVPVGPARQALAAFLTAEFMQLKRYKDAAYAQPYAAMLEQLAATTPKNNPNLSVESRQLEHAYQIKRYAVCLEILGGSGQLKEARELLAKALAFDGSTPAKDEYRRHLELAGQAALLGDPAKK